MSGTGMSGSDSYRGPYCTAACRDGAGGPAAAALPLRAGRLGSGAGWQRGGALAVALCLGAGLGGCGGGGGGGGSAASALAAPGVAQIRTAATTSPRFGSVTQSSQSNGGVTQGSTTAASPSSGPLTVTATITGQGLPSDQIAVSTDSDLDGGTTFAAGEALFDDSLGTVTHRRELAYGVFSRGDLNGNTVSSANGLLGVSVLTDRFDASAADEYLIFGAWVYFPTGANVGDGSRSVLGVFSDGVETDTATNALPTTGAAIYNGHSLGWAVADLGDGDTSASLLYGAVSLNADFGAGMVSGTVSDLRFDLSGNPDFGGDYQQRRTTVTLGAATFGANGQFMGTVTAVADDTAIDLSERLTYSSVNGQWGGRFFGNAGAGMSPPAIGGTWGVTANIAPADGGPERGNLAVAGGFGAWR